jgi:hypothetical protein
MIGLAAQQHGRVRLLQRLGVEPDRVEADELALEGRFLLRPECLHRQYALAQ